MKCEFVEGCRGKKQAIPELSGSADAHQVPMGATARMGRRNFVAGRRNGSPAAQTILNLDVRYFQISRLPIQHSAFFNHEFLHIRMFLDDDV